VGISGSKWEIVVERRQNARRSVYHNQVEQMFLGRYEHTIDEKGRLTIPARYRDLLENGAYVTQGFDRNLIVLDAPSFEKMYENVNQMSMTDPTARQLKRFIFSSAERVEIDRAGRMLLPQFLREAAILSGTAMIIGVGDYFEIWSSEHWAQQNAFLQDIDANAQRFAALNLPIR
jgi:MraZ protein